MHSHAMNHSHRISSHSSQLQKSLSPNLPDDLAISFYLQSHKLIFAVYQLTNIQGTMKFDSCQAECSVPWLNEVLILFTVALQLCQQLKDKVSRKKKIAFQFETREWLCGNVKNAIWEWKIKCGLRIWNKIRTTMICISRRWRTSAYTRTHAYPIDDKLLLPQSDNFLKIAPLIFL